MRKVGPLLSLFLLTLALIRIYPLHSQTPTSSFAQFLPQLRYPCRQTTSPEFHPLRPYPASPCDPLIPRKIPEAPASTDPEKLYLTFKCAKSLNTSGTVTVVDVVDVPSLPALPSNPMDATPEVMYRCNPSINTTEVCFTKDISFALAISLSAAELPILGNAQLLLDDQTKANSYLNWYLNGTVLHSEQLPLNASNPAGAQRLTTYSGPLAKLLPQTAQTALRQTLQNTAVSVDVHNYRLYGGTRLASAPISLYKFVPFASNEDVTSEVTASVIRSQQPPSDGQILTIDLIINSPTDSRLYFANMRSAKALSDLLASVHKPLTTPTPPLSPSDPLISSQRITQHQGRPGVVPGGSDDTIVQIDREYPGSTQITRNTEVIENSPAPAALYTPSPPDCEITDTRINPGDNLLGSTINATLTYRQLFRYTPREITRFEPPDCITEGGLCSDSSAFPCCWHSCEGYQEAECRGDPVCHNLTESICEASSMCEWHDEELGHCPRWPRHEITSAARVSVFTKTPLIERIYDTLVTGSQSVLRRWLPRRPDSIPDNVYLKSSREETIPGTTSVTYTGTTADLNNPRVTAGSGTSGAALYFPHLGSLSDYFLGAPSFENNNLQRHFRPRRYGNLELPLIMSDINCNQSVPQTDTPCVNRENYFRIAEAWLTRGHTNARECYNDAVRRAQAGGVNPGLVLLTWVNESDASNYDAFDYPIEDFGVHTGPYSNPNDFNSQITGYINHVNFIRTACASQLASGADPVRVYAARYMTSSCIGNPLTDNYADGLRVKWSWIGGSCPFPFP